MVGLVQGQGGLRHQGNLCVTRVLDDRAPPIVLDVGKAPGAVFVGAGKQHTQQAVAIGIGRRDEQEVDRWAREMHRFFLAQRQRQVALHRQVVTRPCHIDLPAADPLLVTCLAHRPMQPPLQHAGQLAVAIVRQVQHAEHRYGERRWQRAEHLEQCRHATGRGADHHCAYAAHDLRKIRWGLTSGSKRSL
ncbi:hypothetical protein D3C80_1438070 [compost metagenome]